MDTKDSGSELGPTIHTYKVDGSEFTIATYKPPTGFWACCQQIPSLNDFGFDAEEVRESVREKIQVHLAESRRFPREEPSTSAPPLETPSPMREGIKFCTELASGFFVGVGLQMLLCLLLGLAVVIIIVGVEAAFVPLAILSLPSLWVLMWVVLSSIPEKLSRYDHWCAHSGYRVAVAGIAIVLAWASIFYVCGVGHEKAVRYVLGKTLSGPEFFELRNITLPPYAFLIGGIAGLACFGRLCSAMRSSHKFAQDAALQRDFASGLERILECKNVETLQALAREYDDCRAECDAPGFVSSRRFSMYSPDAFRIITPLDAQRLSGVYQKLSNFARAEAAKLPAKTKVPLPPMEL